MAESAAELLARLLGPPPPKPVSKPLPDAIARLLAGGPAPLKFDPAARPSAPPVDVRATPGAPVSPIPFSVPALSIPVVSRPASGMFSGIEAAKKPRKPAPKPNAAAPSLAEIFGRDDLVFHANSKVADAVRRAGVQHTFELDRILQIPRRAVDFDRYEDLTERYRKPGGTMRLRPIQNAILHEAALAGGLLAPVCAGGGKTLASLLVGAAMGAKRIVLLVPPQLRAQLMSVDIPMLVKHWNIPLDRLRVVAYSELSNARSADILEILKPDLIVADEVHLIKSRAAARTKRFNRFFKEHPECRLVGLSGTVTRKSLRDFQHISELALGKNSPVPSSFNILNEWSEALDASDDPMPPGALLQLLSPEERAIAEDPAALTSPEAAAAAHQAVRSGFRRRLIETPGVVATSESAIGTSLIIRAKKPIVPAEVQVALSDLRLKWEIAGDELTDILEVSRVGRQLAAGIFSRWKWPLDDAGRPIVDTEWLSARSAWNKEVREVLKRSKPGMDSPMLVTKAVIDGKFHSEAYWTWVEQKKKYDPEPPRETVWVSDFLVHAAIAWAKDEASKATPAIIWTESIALGEAIAKESGFPYFGAGAKAAEDLTKIDPKKTPAIICSIRAQSVGKNLQWASKNLLTTCPSGGADLEQLIARSHRPGQEADEVIVDVFVHTQELSDAFNSACYQANYIEHSTGQKQKLNFATKVGFDPESLGRLA